VRPMGPRVTRQPRPRLISPRSLRKGNKSICPVRAGRPKPPSASSVT
jgi:hypothetical protein